jgi:hypothetical protein
LHAGRPLQALHLIDVVLDVAPEHADARSVARDAHAVLLADSTNFWERAWLTKSIEQLDPPL